MSQLSDKALCSVVYRLVSDTFHFTENGGIQTMYEEPYLKIMFLTEDDVIRTSGEWEDDNVVDDGWT